MSPSPEPAGPAGPEPAVDVVVIGAGPAGMAAAVTASAAGAQVVVLDGEARPGGQYWRHGAAGFGRHHHDAPAWSALAGPWSAGIRAGGIDHRPGHRVWRLETLPEVGPGLPAVLVHAVRTAAPSEGSSPGSSQGVERGVTLAARAVVVATGAHDRVLPFPGWDLPGVLTPGAVQSLLKEHGVVAGRRVVVGGTGPFLLPVAAALLTAGAQVPALVEAGSGAGWSGAWRALPAVRERLPEAAGYLARLARARVVPRLRHAVVRAHGRDAVEAVSIARLDRGGRVVPGTERRIGCDAVAVGWGFVARAELALQVGALATTGPDGGVAIAADASGRTRVRGVFVAGELTGIGGAALAVVTGHLAGGGAAAHATRAAPAARAVPAGRPGTDPALLARRRRLLAFAQVMHRAHPVPEGWTTWLDDDTVVCRCEEVPLRSLHEAVDELGATEPRTAKLFTRCGMGWCQGRMCGEALATVVAARTGRTPGPTGPPGSPRAGAEVAARPVAVPITLGALAGAEPTPQEDR